MGSEVCIRDRFAGRARLIATPAPPAALMTAYAAKAQLLGPLPATDGWLAGWISVHYVDGTHTFTADEERAMDTAREAVARLTGIGS